MKIKITKDSNNFINDGFRQYDSGSHQSGNDTEIDEYGNPVSNGVASIQNKENMYNGFIFSDTLTNPETGNKFNADAMKINKKYPKARFDESAKNTMEFELRKLQQLNQNEIDSQSTEMAYGGYIRPTMTNPYAPQGIPEVDPMDAFNQADELVNYKIEPFAPLPTPLQSRSTELNLPYFNSTTNTVDLTNSNNVQGNLPNTGISGLDAVGLGLKGVALLGSINDALTPAEIETPILPDYSKARQYLQSANIDYSQAKQDSIGVSNQQSNAIRSMSGNASQYLSRQSGRLAQLQDVLSNINQSQSNAQSQLNMSKGQFEGNVAVDNANRLTQNRINNQQNAANSRLFDRVLSSDFSQIGTQFGEEARVQKAIANNQALNTFTNAQIISALNSKYGNFQLNDNIIEQFKSGKIGLDDILKYKQ